jgi:hypothetical protein
MNEQISISDGVYPRGREIDRENKWKKAVYISHIFPYPNPISNFNVKAFILFGSHSEKRLVEFTNFKLIPPNS